MRSVTIGLSAMITCIALAAAPAGAQSRTTNPPWYSDRHTTTSASLYPYMDTVGFPQEWHAHRRSSTGAGDVGTPPPEAVQTTRYGDGRSASRSPRLYAEAMRATTQVRPTRRPNLAPWRSPSRTVPADGSYAEPQWRLARTLRSSQPYAVQRRLPVRILPVGSPAAQQHWSPANLRSSRSPYAFMDTVGFPQEYHQAAARTGVFPPRRTTGSLTRRAPRSRTSLPPGFVEIQ